MRGQTKNIIIRETGIREVVVKGGKKIKEPYTIIPNEEMKFAFENIKTRASLILWLYFMGNTQRYHAEKTIMDICEETNISYESYNKSMKQLSDMGLVTKDANTIVVRGMRKEENDDDNLDDYEI